jgi:hypothetical protein
MALESKKLLENVKSSLLRKFCLRLTTLVICQWAVQKWNPLKITQLRLKPRTSTKIQEKSQTKEFRAMSDVRSLLIRIMTQNKLLVKFCMESIKMPLKWKHQPKLLRSSIRPSPSKVKIRLKRKLKQCLLLTIWPQRKVPWTITIRPSQPKSSI